jgi:hypothetical protein
MGKIINLGEHILTPLDTLINEYQASAKRKLNEEDYELVKAELGLYLFQKGTGIMRHLNIPEVSKDKQFS